MFHPIKHLLSPALEKPDSVQCGGHGWATGRHRIASRLRRENVIFRVLHFKTGKMCSVFSPKILPHKNVGRRRVDGIYSKVT